MKKRHQAGKRIAAWLMALSLCMTAVPAEQVELPFKAGIEAGASCVLVAHNTVNALDSENPASLSPTIHNMLRDECGFDGVIMTDDIAMGAVADMENVYVKAVNAGNDLLITTDYQTGYNQILNAVKCGEISEETLNSAVERVLKMKGQI